MKKFLLFILVIASFTVFSCKQETAPATLKLVFKGKFDGNTLVLNQNENYVDGTPMRITHLQFYLSNILLFRSGPPVVVKDIGLVDFSQHHMNATDAAAGESIEITDITPGSYTAIQFGLGVSAPLNAMLPSEFGTGHPLSNSGNHWTAWNSFIFTKVEGRADPDMDGIYDASILYHTGGDDLYKILGFDGTFSLEEGQTTTLTFDLDALKLFYNPSDTLDIIANGVSHTTPTDSLSVSISTFVTDNYQFALKKQ